MPLEMEPSQAPQVTAPGRAESRSGPRLVTANPGTPPGLRQWRLACLAALACVCAVGLTREWRVHQLTAPFIEGLHAPLSDRDLRYLAKAVSQRFKAIAERGPLGQAAVFPLRTEADYLLIGGACGHA